MPKKKKTYTCEVYTLPRCTQCRQVMGMLTENGIEFEVKDLEKDLGIERAKLLYGIASAPLVLYKDDEGRSIKAGGLDNVALSRIISYQAPDDFWSE